MSFLQLISSVIYTLDSIRLAGLVNFYYDFQSGMVREVNRVMFYSLEEVEPTSRAKARLYDGSGTKSPDTRAKVVELWKEFAQHIKRYELGLATITFGRGMLDFVEDKEFTNMLGEIGFEGVMCDISHEYAMYEMNNDIMSALVESSDDLRVIIG